MRIHAVRAYNLDDPTYSMWLIATWSQLEPTLGIMCACAPFMRPVFKRLLRQFQSSSRRRHTVDIETVRLADHASGYSELRGPKGSMSARGKTANFLDSDSTGADERRDTENHPIPCEALIRVERSFVVDSQEKPP